MGRRAWIGWAVLWLSACASPALSPESLQLDRQVERNQAVQRYEQERLEREKERERTRREVEQTMRMRWDDYRQAVRGGAPVPPPEQPAEEPAGPRDGRGTRFWIPLVILVLFIAGVKLATARMTPAERAAPGTGLNPPLREEGESGKR